MTGSVVVCVRERQRRQVIKEDNLSGPQLNSRRRRLRAMGGWGEGGDGALKTSLCHHLSMMRKNTNFVISFVLFCVHTFKLSFLK